MEISKQQIRHIREVLNKENISYLNATLSEWFPNVLEEKLFTTEDGVDIYKGEQCWAGVPEKGIGDFNLDDWEGDTLSIKYFSTLEEAQKYIDEKVLNYTKRDIVEAVNNWCQFGINIEDIDNFLGK